MNRKYGLLGLMAWLGLGLTTANAALGGEKNAEGYHIEITAPQLRDSTIRLGYYFYGKTYVKDSVTLDKNGRGAWKGEKKLPQGMYFGYYEGHSFEFIIGEDANFKIVVDTTDLAGKTQYIGAEETEDFAAYSRFLKQKREEVKVVNEKYKSEKQEEKKKVELERINEEVKSYQTNLRVKGENRLTSLILEANEPVALLEDDPAVPDSIQRLRRYYHYKEHFFDHVPLDEPRLLYTPFVNAKVETYLDKVISQSPDTITTEMVKLVEKSKKDTLTFKNMLSTLFNKAIQSKQMGIDRAWCTLAQKYYLSGEATWADTTFTNKLEKEVAKVRYNFVGDKGRDMVVEDLDGTKYHTNELGGDYILILFFEPTCGHCKKEVPNIFKTVFEKYKDKGFEVVCFYIGDKRKEWEDFVNDKELYAQGWHNVWDPQRESWFWYFYDTSTTPGIYLLDKERKIIAKKIDAETMDMILAMEMGLPMPEAEGDSLEDKPHSGTVVDTNQRVKKK